MKILKIEDLHKTYRIGFKKNEVLKGINLSLDKGEVLGFLGPNGAGKTTTMKCILGFARPTKGKILIFGENLEKNRDILKKIGYAPEQAYYYPHLTGEEFLYFTGRLNEMKKKELDKKVPIFLKKVGLEFAKNRYIKTYSKGMKQRLGIASSIIHDPELVFFDEPMSGLDPLGRNLVKNLMIELKEKGTSIFFNTHILSDVQEIADRFSIINKGQIIYEDKVENINENLEDFFVKKIKEADSSIEIK